MLLIHLILLIYEVIYEITVANELYGISITTMFYIAIEVFCAFSD